MIYTIFETATGKIVSVGNYRADQINAYLEEGQSVYEGEVDTNVFDRIVDGEPCAAVTVFYPETLARNLRDMALQGSDWTQSADSPLSEEAKAAWRTYRQELRDFPTKVQGCETTHDVENLMPIKPRVQ
mgnify:CR=1 FL=1|tara:strand:+ start:7847 stop:8233 length:387 start_codon:yes stop_codon:yes gene_type:complete